uniref:Uncharacterized protein n=2 Tax=Cucumis melo TaxID=3656 RepID=A0A9I9EHA0_CUCME
MADDLNLSLGSHGADLYFVKSLELIPSLENNGSILIVVPVCEREGILRIEKLRRVILIRSSAAYVSFIRHVVSEHA